MGAEETTEVKPWYRSKTILKAALKMLISLISTVFGVSINVPEATYIGLVGGIDSLFDVWLRFKTNKPVSVRSVPDTVTPERTSEQISIDRVSGD